jgi:hypothetical protein
LNWNKKDDRLAMEKVLQDKEWHTGEIDDIASLLEVDVNDGLNELEVKLRQTRVGLNRN